MIFLAVVVLLGAIYYYTFAVTEQVDKRADYTDGLIRDVAEKSAKATLEMAQVAESRHWDSIGKCYEP